MADGTHLLESTLRRPLAPAGADPRADHVLPIDPVLAPPDAAVVARLPAGLALGLRLLPWRRLGAATLVLCEDPAEAARHLDLLERSLGPVRLALAGPAALSQAIETHVARPLARRAERRVPAAASCRTLRTDRLGRWMLAAGTVLAALLLTAPLALLAALTLVAATALALSTILKLVAVAATLRRTPSSAAPGAAPGRPPEPLPVITVFVPLYREVAIARHLLARMEAIDYPRALFDLCLLVEDDDVATQRALKATDVPAWVRVVEVPEGTIRTKPRALNYGLAFARGSIVGIYDAKDVPAPGHLRQVAAAFAARGPEVACLQGVLDYFNEGTNWVARCFTLEYATWFRVVLPGLARLRLVVPLGGTTLFLRRAAIEAVGGWDAHNVTEDADLGVRLARAGLRTEMIPIVTMEEANARMWPWVRQRSRWLKGYALTYAVHMRAPGRLWLDLGGARFLAFQVQFLGTLAGFAFAPLLWSFYLIPLGLPHPLAPMLAPALLVALSILFLAAQVLDLALGWVGMRRAGRPALAAWGPTFLFYFPLATIALYRALWEVLRCPFRWDKTAHGLHAPMIAGRPAY